jgi:hypothetical protein
MKSSPARSALALGALAAMLCTATSVHAEPTKCKREIAKRSSQFAQAKIVALQKCEEALLKGATTGPCPDAKTATKIAQAEAKLRSAISAKCGGADHSCGTADDDPLAAIGWNIGSCPDFETAGCTNAISNCSGISDCLSCANEAAVDQAIDLYYGALAPSSNGSVQSCQRDIGKNAVKFLRAKSKALQKCEDAVLKGAAGPCPDAQAAAKIASARAKQIQKMCSSCGGADRACGGGDDLTPVQIGFASTCPSVTIPGGASCGGSIGTLQDLVTCVDCVTEFKADCLDPLAVPAVRAYPSECHGGGSVPTPTRTPTALPTATRTATPGGGGATPTATPTPSCGNNTVDPGEDCDGTDTAACPGQCSASCACPGPCVLPNPIPEVFSLVAKPGIDLDTGWTGIAHDVAGDDDGSLLALRLTNCDLDTSSATCGQCNAEGPVAFPGPSKNCACYNLASPDASSLATCDPESPTCSGGETCECFYGPPLAISSGAVPVCVVNRYQGPVVGTANMAESGPHAGEGAALLRLASGVYSGIAVEQPCPTCDNDPTPGDGVRGGTCNGGARDGLACDVGGTSRLFGELSLACLPNSTAAIGNLQIKFNKATTGTTSLAANLPCTAFGFTDSQCPCDTCATAEGEACSSDADCPAGVTCGGLRCIGGTNSGSACTDDTQCPGDGACNRPGLPTQPNQCSNTVCVANPNDHNNANEAFCQTGPNDTLCSREPFRGCVNASDCNPPPSGNCPSCAPNQACSIKRRQCFLDTIIRQGTPGTQSAVLAATFCIPPTVSSAVNQVAGLPGPGAVVQPTRIFRSGSQCGNGALDGGEQCDGSNDAACPGACQANCTCPSCGDNAVNGPSEECDGSDDDACPGACQANCTCTTGTCGNGMAEFGEECDGADAAACPGACQTNCTCGAVCGDGVIDPGEQCDGSGTGGACPASACQANCTCGPFCGNNQIDPGEQCDGNGTGSCAGTCQADCMCAPFCGDDVRQAGELCDGTDDSLCPGHCSAGCTCPSSAQITFTVQEGADLDTGWTGTAHDAQVQKGSSISGELSNCDGVSDFECDFFGNVGSACSADPGQPCLSDGDCSAGYCVISTFGPPLPLSAGGVPACIVNRFATDVTGTYNMQTGDAQLFTHLSSLVHLGVQVSRPCPICDCGLVDPNDCQIGDTGTCTDVSGSPPCTVQGTGPLGPTSNNCLPSASSNVSGGGLDIPFQPITTGTSTFPSNQPCDGSGFQNQSCWCDGQPQPTSCSAACDGGSNDNHRCSSDADCPGAPAGACKTLCRQIAGEAVGEGECVAGPIVQTCAGAPEIGCQTNSNCPSGKGPCAANNQRCFLDPIVRVGSPSTTLNTSVATFCIPATSASAINNTAGLPGPGAISFPAAVDLKKCGDNVKNRFVEECDGSDDANCPGQCLANCTCNQTCGNNVIEFGEQCDGTSDAACPGQCGAPATPQACLCPTVCGDGFVAPTEECDPPNDSRCPGQCTNCTCPVPTATCLNGTLDPGEPCELPGLGCGPSQVCLLCQQCFPPYDAITPYLGFICGNQIQEPTEACELPAIGCDPGQLCLGCSQCVNALPFCGNENIEPGEACELPAIGCGQHQLCLLCNQCIDVPISICGNGVIEDGEACELPQTGCGPLAICELCQQCVPLL